MRSRLPAIAVVLTWFAAWAAANGCGSGGPAVDSTNHDDRDTQIDGATRDATSDRPDRADQGSSADAADAIPADDASPDVAPDLSMEEVSPPDAAIDSIADLMLDSAADRAEVAARDADPMCPMQTLAQIAGGAQCPVLAQGIAASPSVVSLWIDGNDDSTGQLLLLRPATPITVGGHTYLYGGDGLFGTGTSSGISGAVIGSIDIRVDGSLQIHFDVEGCIGPDWADASGVSSFVANVTARSGCPGCSPATIVRDYALTRLDGGPGYRFAQTSAFVGCGAGVELVEFELQ